jgi:pteridine reductase
MSQRALITGASGSIGAAIAAAIAGPGAALVLQYRSSEERAREAARHAEGSGSKVDLIGCDISEAGAPEWLVAKACEAMGGLDLLVHCAAIFDHTPLESVTPEVWDRIVAVNLKAPFFLAKAAAYAMKGGGSMIFLSDVAAAKPYSGYLPYCISKAGIESLVRGLARSLAPAIRVNAIAPYVVTRPEGMSDKGWNDLLCKTPMRRPSTPEEIASIARALVESETVTGQVICVDGGRLLR